jgi:hypothetical protein
VQGLAAVRVPCQIEWLENVTHGMHVARRKLSLSMLPMKKLLRIWITKTVSLERQAGDSIQRVTM